MNRQALLIVTVLITIAVIAYLKMRPPSVRMIQGVLTRGCLDHVG